MLSISGLWIKLSPTNKRKIRWISPGFKITLSLLLHATFNRHNVVKLNVVHLILLYLFLRIQLNFMSHIYIWVHLLNYFFHVRRDFNSYKARNRTRFTLLHCITSCILFKRLLLYIPLFLSILYFMHSYNMYSHLI